VLNYELEIYSTRQGTECVVILNQTYNLNEEVRKVRKINEKILKNIDQKQFISNKTIYDSSLNKLIKNYNIKSTMKVNQIQKKNLSFNRINDLSSKSKSIYERNLKKSSKISFSNSFSTNFHSKNEKFQLFSSCNIGKYLIIYDDFANPSSASEVRNDDDYSMNLRKNLIEEVNFDDDSNKSSKDDENESQNESEIENDNDSTQKNTKENRRISKISKISKLNLKNEDDEEEVEDENKTIRISQVEYNIDLKDNLKVYFNISNDNDYDENDELYENIQKEYVDNININNINNNEISTCIDRNISNINIINDSLMNLTNSINYDFKINQQKKVTFPFKKPKLSSYIKPTKPVIISIDDNFYCRQTIKSLFNSIKTENNLDFELVSLSDGLDLVSFIVKSIVEEIDVRLIISDENMVFCNGSNSLLIVNMIYSLLNKSSKPPRSVILTALEGGDLFVDLKKKTKAMGVYRKPMSRVTLKEVILKSGI
jgi:hypothetical protein